VLLLLLLLFLLVIPSAASEPAFSRSLPVLPQKLCIGTNPCPYSSNLHAFLLTPIEKREKAGSLAALGMTSKKDKDKKQILTSSQH
jgi:hypothetical protein